MKKIKQFILRHFVVKNTNGLSRTAEIDRNTVLCGKNFVGSNSKIRNSTLGFQSCIGNECDIENTSIGKFSCVSHRVVVVQGRHPTEKLLSIHPSFFNDKYKYSYVKSCSFDSYKYINEDKKVACIIGNDVWIGYGALIMAGVKIGDGAIIGAGSIVTKDVEPYSIVAGVPAKTIRYRFSSDVVKRMIELKWWDQDEEWIKNNAHLFKDESLLELISSSLKSNKKLSPYKK